MASQPNVLRYWWRLLALVIPLAAGWAGGAPRAAPAAQSHAILSTPRQSVPTPVHDEATCAFCQAAAFPPLASAGSAVVPLAFSDVEVEPIAPSDRSPDLRVTRRPTSRAPPSLRSV